MDIIKHLTPASPLDGTSKSHRHDGGLSLRGSTDADVDERETTADVDYRERK